MTDVSFQKVFRPVNTKQLIGEDQIKIAKSLVDRIERKEIIRRLLFAGPSGVGKTVLSEIYIRTLLGLSEEDNIRDYITEINCTAETGIDHIRNVVLANMHHKSYLSPYRIFFLDELHGLSKSAQNALLTPIEQLPDHCIVIAATTELNKIIETLKSRFTTHQLSKPSRQELEKKATWICLKYGKAHKEGNKISFENGTEKTINEIIDHSAGNIRTFDLLMEQLIDGSYTGFEDSEESTFFVRELLFGNLSLSKAFELAQKEKDYNGLCVSMSRYAIAIIRNPKSYGQALTNSKKILELFGQGLPNTTDEMSSFHRLLLRYYE